MCYNIFVALYKRKIIEKIFIEAENMAKQTELDEENESVDGESIATYYDGEILKRRVLHLCKKWNLSTARAESKLHFANGTLKKLEKNTPSAARIFELAQFFDVTTDYLLGLSNRKHVPKIDRFDTLWNSLDIDQQSYVLGLMQGIVQYDAQEMKDAVRSEPLIIKRRRAIRNQIDELQAEYSALEKTRKKKGYRP